MNFWTFQYLAPLPLAIAHQELFLTSLDKAVLGRGWAVSTIG
ncbi:MAG: hypothetical protein ACFE0I_10355 [Elainellaceae cyanobacterium]